MKTRRIPVLAALVGTLLVVRAPLRADEIAAADLADSTQNYAASPRRFLLEVKFGPYLPEVDSEFKRARPFKDVFGSSSVLMTQLGFEVQFFQAVGSLAVGFGVGFSNVSGHSLTSYDPYAGDAVRGSDESDLYVMPFMLSLVYRFDYLAERFSVPLVPYVKAGFDYVVWWATDDNGDISDWASGSGKTRLARGGVWGWHAGAGLAFLLDVFAPTMAATFDIEVGVNNSFLFAEYVYLGADDFGQGNSIRLSDGTFLFGIAFEF